MGNSNIEEDLNISNIQLLNVYKDILNEYSCETICIMLKNQETINA